MAVTNETFHAETSLRAFFQRAAIALREWRVQRAKFRQTFDELSALSDRELADLGIHRTEIGEIARGTTTVR
ncbi:hypothetical protein C2I36_09985 [Rhodobacteraceae bacterium WD3A24]|nr:hypothetical protein C2I36_09985 [Rhodobacteraceae bacterium WD3A24]